jgi:hypothetical protein
MEIAYKRMIYTNNKWTMNRISNKGVNELIKNCVNFQNLSLTPWPNTTIKVLIDIAINNPQIKFNYYRQGFTEKLDNMFEKMQLPENIRFSG